MTFDVEKLDGLATRQKNWRYVYSFRQNHERERRTDTQTDTAWRHRPRLQSIARQKACKTTHNSTSGAMDYADHIPAATPQVYSYQKIDILSQ